MKLINHLILIEDFFYPFVIDGTSLDQIVANAKYPSLVSKLVPYL